MSIYSSLMNIQDLTLSDVDDGRCPDSRQAILILCDMILADLGQLIKIIIASQIIGMQSIKVVNIVIIFLACFCQIGNQGLTPGTPLMSDIYDGRYFVLSSSKSCS